jgi:hypothetical protein
MGMECIVTFRAEEPTWSAIRARIESAGGTVQMRMIDGMPAFPDEEPTADWREIRVSLGGGMLTLRREPGRMRVIVWGNADEALKRDQQTLAQAWADVGGGLVA